MLGLMVLIGFYGGFDCGCVALRLVCVVSCFGLMFVYGVLCLILVLGFGFVF